MNSPLCSGINSYIVSVAMLSFASPRIMFCRSLLVLPFVVFAFGPLLPVEAHLGHLGGRGIGGFL